MLPVSNKKICMLLLYSLMHLFFVAEQFEISNHDLIRDIERFRKLEEALSEVGYKL
jgi:hypothetical protein